MKNELQQLEELASHEGSLKVLAPYNKPESSYIDSNGTQVNVYKNRSVLNSHFNEFFNTPVQEAKQAINGTTKFMKSDDEKRLYINEILRILDNILEVNKRNCKFSTDLKCEILHGWNDYHFGLFMKLINLKISLEKEYEPYIEKPVQKTFDEFDNCLFHKFLKEYNTIYDKTNKPNIDCTTQAKSRIENVILDSLSLFREKYPTFAKNWVANQKELGHQKAEEDYISLLLNKKRFITDDNTRKVSAKNKKCIHCDKIFEFRVEFYDEYVKRYYDLQNEFLKERLSEITLNQVSPVKQLKKFNTVLSVTQLGLLFDLLRQKGIIDERTPQSDIEQFVISNFSSKKQANISRKSLHNKLSQIPDNDRLKVNDLLMDMYNENKKAMTMKPIQKTLK